jgi:hypothetical protein
MYLRTTNYVPSLKSIVFLSERYEGAQNLFLMSLVDGKIIQLTASKDKEDDNDDTDADSDRDDDEIDGDHAAVSPATEEAFFKQGQTLKRVSLSNPGAPRPIYTQKDSDWDLRGTPSISSDGKTIATMEYNKGSDKKEYTDDDRTRIVTIAVKDGQDPEETDPHQVAKVDGKGDHLWINPGYGDTIIYHTLFKDGDDAEVGLAYIGSGDTEVLEPQEAKGHGVHPFWRADGKVAGYVRKDKPDGDFPQEVATYIRGRDDDGTVNHDKRVGYKIPEGYSSSHLAMNPSGTLLQGDGGNDEDSSFIYYYEINSQGDVKKPWAMFQHGSCKDHGERFHPHADFINETDVLFNSDAFFLRDPDGKCEDPGEDEKDKGDGNIYLLRKK